MLKKTLLNEYLKLIIRYREIKKRISKIKKTTNQDKY